MNRIKLKNLLKALTPDKTAVDFSNFDNEVTKLKEKLKEQVVVKTLEDVNVQLEKNRKKINFEPLLAEFEQLKKTIEAKNTELSNLFDNKQRELTALVKQSNSVNDDKINQLILEVAELSVRKIEIPDFAKQITDTELRLMTVINNLPEDDDSILEKEIKDLTEALEKLKKDLLNRINNIGGGSMNRKITFGGTDYLTRYTDINYKAGSNVTFTVVNNNQTKMVDVTISSSGGGGGSVRSINSISSNTTAGSTAGTDYVYLVSGTTTVTMPDAVGNTNLYTIKNVGTGVVTINTTSSQRIDNNLTIQMATQYTSVDLISDTANWNIT